MAADLVETDLAAFLCFMIRLKRDEAVEILQLHSASRDDDSAFGAPRTEQDALDFGLEGEKCFEETVLLLVQVNGADVRGIALDRRSQRQVTRGTPPAMYRAAVTAARAVPIDVVGQIGRAEEIEIAKAEAVSGAPTTAQRRVGRLADRGQAPRPTDGAEVGGCPPGRGYDVRRL